MSDLTGQLQSHVKKFEVDETDLVQRGVRNPLFSMLYFVLWQNEARDWLSGLKLSSKHVGRAHRLEYHHIFPKSLLQKANYDEKEINEIANLAFIGGKANRQILNKPPAVYFPTDVIPNRGEQALTSQLIPLSPELWKIENYQEFLDFRRKAIATAINSFVRRFE